MNIESVKSMESGVHLVTMFLHETKYTDISGAFSCNNSLYCKIDNTTSIRFASYDKDHYVTCDQSDVTFDNNAPCCQCQIYFKDMA